VVAWDSAADQPALLQSNHVTSVHGRPAANFDAADQFMVGLSGNSRLALPQASSATSAMQRSLHGTFESTAAHRENVHHSLLPRRPHLGFQMLGYPSAQLVPGSFSLTGGDHSSPAVLATSDVEVHRSVAQVDSQLAALHESLRLFTHARLEHAIELRKTMRQVDAHSAINADRVPQISAEDAAESWASALPPQRNSEQVYASYWNAAEAAPQLRAQPASTSVRPASYPLRPSPASISVLPSAAASPAVDHSRTLHMQQPPAVHASIAQPTNISQLRDTYGAIHSDPASFTAHPPVYHSHPRQREQDLAAARAQLLGAQQRNANWNPADASHTRTPLSTSDELAYSPAALASLSAPARSFTPTAPSPSNMVGSLHQQHQQQQQQQQHSDHGRSTAQPPSPWPSSYAPLEARSAAAYEDPYTQPMSMPHLQAQWQHQQFAARG
jgi:hypothetical protein